MDEINLGKSMTKMLTILIGIVCFTFLFDIIKDAYIQRSIENRDYMACIPNDMSISYPIVYHQGTTNPVVNNALINSFIEEYVKLTQDEKIINYHSEINNNRYKDATSFSESRKKAIYMSLIGSPEREKNLRMWSESNKTFNRLKQANMGWVFLIDDIIPQGVPGTPLYHIVVRGEFQAIYDNAKRPVDQQLPAKLWGYKEFRYQVVVNSPDMTVDDKYLNKYGIYVSSSSERDINPLEKDRYTKRNHDFYLLDGGK
tara:strand:- start:4024 stop:4794 length:771 start_codon:yes stop_codon:yes gene_type:complete